MAQKDTDAIASMKDTLNSHLRSIQLLTRLLLISSAVEGFQLQAADVQSICIWLLDYIERVQKTLEQIKPEVRHANN